MGVKKNSFQENLWTKRGLALLPLRWPQVLYNEQFSVQVAIYQVSVIMFQLLFQISQTLSKIV